MLTSTSKASELEGYPFPVVGGSGALDVVLRTDVGSVAGTVVNGDNNPVQALVVAAPKNRKQEHVFRTAKAESEWHFSH